MYITTANIEQAHKALGLKPFAQPHDIRRAWRTKAHQTHPDHGGSAQDFAEIQAAAMLLLAEGAREFYETQMRHAAANSATTHVTPPPTSQPANSSKPTTLARAWSRRRPVLFMAGVFGYLIAPHFQEIGISWNPAPFHEFCEVMQSLDWVFLTGWMLWVKKAPTQQRRASSLRSDTPSTFAGH